MLVLLDSLLAAIEPERAAVEFTVATIEPLVEPLGARAVVPFHVTVSPLDLPVPVLHVAFTVLEPPLDPIVVAGASAGR